MGNKRWMEKVYSGHDDGKASTLSMAQRSQENTVYRGAEGGEDGDGGRVE